MVENMSADVLVIGGGGAALRAAVQAAASGLRVSLVDKGAFGNSGSSPKALGGFATSFNPADRPELFLADWMRCSGGICDHNLVWEAITHSVENVLELEAMGLEFLHDEEGQRNLYRGAGHSLARGLTAKYHSGDGPGIIEVLSREARKRGVQVHEGIMVTQLLQGQEAIAGAIGVSTQRKFFIFSAPAVVLAAGGANRLYSQTAAPIQEERYRTTGDAFCLAMDAGVPLVDMEFTQFRDSPPGAARFGGRYLNTLGERFMERYDPVYLEKAPRYRMAEAIYREIKAGRGPIMWEVGGIQPSEREMALARAYGQQRQVEITLDFQRLMGGAHINEKAQTKLAGLFAAGESAGGVHGADRMQGNGFLETQVFGANAGRNAAIFARSNPHPDLDFAQVDKELARIDRFRGNCKPREVSTAVRNLMWEKVGIVRDGLSLAQALKEFRRLRQQLPRLSGEDIFAALEAENLLRTAQMVTTAALARKESRGSNIRSDYPQQDDALWLKHICLTSRGGRMVVSSAPVSPYLKAQY